MEKIIGILFLGLNLLTLLVFYIDKQKARKKSSRISEKSLLTYCALGGSIGGFIAMQAFRHKTQKRSFLLPFYAIVALQVGLIYAYFKYIG